MDCAKARSTALAALLFTGCSAAPPFTPLPDSGPEVIGQLPMPVFETTRDYFCGFPCVDTVALDGIDRVWRIRGAYGQVESFSFLKAGIATQKQAGQVQAAFSTLYAPAPGSCDLGSAIVFDGGGGTVSLTHLTAPDSGTVIDACSDGGVLLPPWNEADSALRSLAR